MSDDVASAVAGTISDLFGGPDVAEEAPSSPDDSAAPEAQVAELPDLNPSLPDDLAEFLEEPDFDDDEEPAVAFADPEEDEYVDAEQLARENAKLKKRLEWTETQKARANAKAWAAEAKKIAPLSRPGTINAQSRRAFLREARKQHEENFSLLAPHIDAYKTAKDQLREQIAAELRAELEEAWGRPTQNSAGVPSAASQKADDLQKARNSRNLAAVAKALISNNEL